MRVLGISSGFHNSAAAISEGSRLLYSAAEERFSLHKADASFPQFAIQAAMSAVGMSAVDFDEVVFYEEPTTKFVRTLASTLQEFPRGRRAFVQAMRNWLGRKLWIRDEISRRLSIHPRKVHFVPHHQSHAAQTFLTSPFTESAVLTVDAVGEWACTTLGVATRTGSPRFRSLLSLDYPHSLGLAYSAFTAYLGFMPNRDECSTMALAAFGQPRYVDVIEKMIPAESDGTYSLDLSYFNFLSEERPYTQRMVNALGEPRLRSDKLSFCAYAHEQSSPSSEHQRFADIAASVQQVLEARLVALARLLRRLSGATNLCLAGGVALNCVANSRIATGAGFAQVHIPPDPGDGGAASGACLAISAAEGALPEALEHPYLGDDYRSGCIPQLLDVRGGSHLRQLRGSSIRVTAFDDEGALIERACEALSHGRILAWVQGRFEHGPRGLGARSILIDPARLDACERLSSRVKRRAGFRPYALSMTEEEAPRLLVGAPAQRHERWMLTTRAVNEAYIPGVRAGLHIDGTTRPQVCRGVDNPRVHALLRAHGGNSGVQALVNTSLNEPGYPIIARPEHALAFFVRSALDVMAVDNVLLEKVQ